MPTFAKAPASLFSVKRPLLYYITDRRQLPGDRIAALVARVKSAVSRGVDFVQVREKDLCDLELFNLAKEIVRLARRTPCKVLVNGRLDVAVACGAHGVHLPSTGIDVRDVTKHIPRGFLVGVSTHSLQEALRAQAGGADYILVGPVFRTESKTGYGPPMGLAPFRRICSAVSVPVLGLGGIRSDRISAVLGAGAAGIAGITLFQKNESRLLRDRGWNFLGKGF